MLLNILNGLMMSNKRGRYKKEELNRKVREALFKLKKEEEKNERQGDDNN